MISYAMYSRLFRTGGQLELMLGPPLSKEPAGERVLRTPRWDGKSNTNTDMTQLYESKDIVSVNPLRMSDPLQHRNGETIETRTTDNGLHVVHQFNVYACEYTVMGMLALDNGMRKLAAQLCFRIANYVYGLVELPAFRNIIHENNPFKKDVFVEYTEHELDLRDVASQCPFVTFVQLNKSDHCIIVDSVDDNGVTIRDPWHGVSLTVKREAFIRSLVRYNNGTSVDDSGNGKIGCAKVTFARSAIFSNDDIVSTFTRIPSDPLSLDSVSVDTWMSTSELYMVRQPDATLSGYAALGMLALDRGMRDVAGELCCKQQSVLKTLFDFKNIRSNHFRIKIKEYTNTPAGTDENWPFIVLVANGPLLWWVVVDEISDNTVVVRDPSFGAYLKVKRASFNNKLISQNTGKILCVRVAFCMTISDIRLYLQRLLTNTRKSGGSIKFQVFEFTQLSHLIATQQLTANTAVDSTEYTDARKLAAGGKKRPSKKYIAAMAIPTGFCTMHVSDDDTVVLKRWEIRCTTLQLADVYWTDVLVPAWIRITFPKISPNTIRIQSFKHRVSQEGNMLSVFKTAFETQINGSVSWKTKKIEASARNEYLRTLAVRYQPKQSIYAKLTSYGSIAILNPLDVFLSMQEKKEFTYKERILKGFTVMGKVKPESIWDAKSIIIPLYNIQYFPLCLHINYGKHKESRLTFVTGNFDVDRDYKIKAWKFVQYLSDSDRHENERKAYKFATDVLDIITNEPRENKNPTSRLEYTPEGYREQHAAALDDFVKEAVKTIRYTGEQPAGPHLKLVEESDFIIGLK
jgi:predicted double-glycine peptidase